MPGASEGAVGTLRAIGFLLPQPIADSASQGSKQTALRGGGERLPEPYEPTVAAMVGSRAARRTPRQFELGAAPRMVNAAGTWLITAMRSDGHVALGG